MRSRPLLILILLALCNLSAWGQDGPFVAFQSARHPFVLRGFCILNGGNWVATIGADKAIRIHDLDDFSLMDCHRFEQGAGRRGEIRCIAASPDGTHYAMGTYGGQGVWPASIYYVSVIPKAKIVWRSEGHSDSINGVTFSPSGRSLASVSDDKTLIIRDTETGGETRRVPFGERISGVAFANENELFVTTPNGVIHRLDLQSPVAKAGSFRAHAGRINGLRIVGDRVVSCGSDGKINIASFRGKTLQSKSFGETSSIASIAVLGDRIFYSLGGEQTAASVAAGSHSTECGLLHFPALTSDRKLKSSRDFISGMTYVAKRKELVGFDGEGTLLRYRLADGRLVATLESQTTAKWRMRFKDGGHVVEWGHVRNVTDARKTSLDQSFDLRRLTFGEGTGVDPNLVNGAYQGIELKFPPESFQEQEWKAQNPESSAAVPFLVARVGKGINATFFWLAPYSKYGDVKFCLPASDNRAVVAADRGCFLVRLDPSRAKVDSRGLKYGHATLIRELHDQQGTVPRMAWTADRKWFLTTASDGAIRIWNGNDFSLLMSVFTTRNDWVAWSKSGYYACSAGGERIMGWHVNNGMDQFADFQVAEQFSRGFFKPDVIRRLLDSGSEDAALSSLPVPRQSIAENLAPKVSVEILDAKPPENGIIRMRDSEIKVRVTAVATGASKLEEVTILENGRGTDNSVILDSPKGVFNKTFDVHLDPGKVRISVRALASNGTHASSHGQDIFYQSNALDKGRRKLHVLGIAVGEYEHPQDFPQLTTVENTASDIVTVFQDHAGDLFTEGVSARLVKPGSRADVFRELAEVRKDFKKTDMLVVYWTGHGEHDAGQFYFVMPDCRKGSLQESGLSAADFAGALSKLEGGSVLLMIDTCFSGRFVRDIEDLSGFVRSSARSDVGVMTIAASSAQSVALDSLFGNVLHKGLLGTDDTTIIDEKNREVVVSQSLKMYMANEVARMSKNSQHVVAAGFEDGIVHQLTLAAAKDSTVE